MLQNVTLNITNYAGTIAPTKKMNHKQETHGPHRSPEKPIQINELI